MILAIDAYDCSPGLLESLTRAETLLRDAADLTGMQIIAGPDVMSYDGGANPQDWGITGVTVIAESHIAIHTWPERRYLQFVLASCRDFDAETLADHVCRYYGSARADKIVADSGLQSALRKGALEPAAI